MSPKLPYARIAITLPPDTLRTADELAARHDRSRSWIVAEAIRQYAAAQIGKSETDRGEAPLGRSRLEQLRRDLALSAESRVLESEELVSLGDARAHPEPPRSFPSYDAFLAWRRRRDAE